MRLLEEFWYGNIEPTDYDISSRKEYKKLQELICRNEEKLRATMRYWSTFVPAPRRWATPLIPTRLRVGGILRGGLSAGLLR